MQFFAAQSLGKLGNAASAEPLLALLRANDNKDAYLRFVASHALSKLEADEALAEGAQGSFGRRAPGRVAGVSLHAGSGHRRASSTIRIRTSCARPPRPSTTRPSEPALAPLAAQAATAPPADQALVVRALNANYRLGEAPRAQALANYALNDKATPEMRAEALQQLALWGKVPARDRVVGIYRPAWPMKARDGADAADALAPSVAKLLGGGAPRAGATRRARCREVARAARRRAGAGGHGEQ